MLQSILGNEPWFEPKRYGYGAGLPIVWQGWALIASYIGGMIGLGLLFETGGLPGMAIAIALMAVLTAFLLIVASRHTRGGWRWRWG